jgi:ABC-type bacteriocin/lantibiotic exporter with double-glycine peptidase domain
MKQVIQADDAGCGIACVAMLARVTYAEARNKMFKKTDGVTGTFTWEVRKALRKFGMKSPKRLRVIRDRDAYRELRHNALLKLVTPSHKSGCWHWVVWDARRKKLLDPRKQPYRRFRITSYLPVSS